MQGYALAQRRKPFKSTAFREPTACTAETRQALERTIALLDFETTYR